MTKRKILSLLLVVMLIVCAFAMVSCNDEPDVPPVPEKTEWPEAGVYKFAAGTTECSLVLNEGDTFTLVYEERSLNGSYTLSNSTLVLNFEDEAEKIVTANYAGNSITLSYDGASMVLYKNVSFTVTFETGAGSDVAAQTVVNGQTATMPENPTREGYDFLGWYVDGAFTSAFNFATPITANTTVYARWNKPNEQLADPEINVSATQISWKSISGARSYLVEIVAPDGTVVFEQSSSATVVNVDFASLDAAVYTVRVTAVAQTGASDNSTKEVLYAHNALNKVTGFEVISPSLLVFDKVENAEKYYVTVVCGNPGHNHENFDNGSNRFFSLENCIMGEDGIKITVTATAEGFASSTSDTFVYKKELDAVTGLTVDEATGTVTWNAVTNAATYMVSVTCGDASHNHGFVNVGSQTFVSLKGCAPCEGGIVVKVYPVTEGYLSPEASELVYAKSALQTPGNLTVNGTTVTWTAVEGATSYEVKIGENTYTVSANSYDMAALLNYVEGTEYAISVRALSDDESSLWTDVLTARYYEMGAALTYGKSVLTWAPVIGAAGYELQVNDGEIITVDGGKTSALITLTKAGVNVLKVRFVDGNVRSDWKSVEVFAHTVTFDTLGGSEIVVQFKAVGDPITLPTPTKIGYTFDAWYNLPGGAAVNGKEYTDSIFAESGSIVLYAQYVANEYEVDLDFAGGSGSSDKGTVSYKNDYTIEVPTAADPSLVFAGWFSAPYGKGVQYTDSHGNSLAPWDKLEGAKLYAFWADYTLSYTLTNVNGKTAYMVSAGDRISLVKEITVPATYKGVNVAMIAGNAFLNCTTLEKINLPATIEQISSVSPFGGCTALKEINVYGVEGVNGRYWSDNGVLFDNGTDTVANPKLIAIPLAKTGSYVIPAGVTEIPEAAFALSKISRVVIPASVTKIGRNAFDGCANLASVVFTAPAEGESASALVIGARAFAGCTALEKITLPARLSDIKLQKYTESGDTVAVDNAENAFAGCTSLLSITVVVGNESYKSVDGMLYSADGKTLIYCPATKAFADGKLEIAAGTQTIAPGAFIDCGSFSELTVPNSVTLIGECAFYGVSSLNKVTFGGDSLVNLVIGKNAFRACSNLSEIELKPGSRIATISEGAFRDCTSLGAITIPATTTSIKADAFNGCTSLETITFEASTQELAFGEDVFYNCTALTTVELPANVSAIPGIFGGCTSLTSVSVHEDNPYFMSDEDGVVFNKAKTEIVFFPRGKSGDYTLPATVTSIANGVFKGVSLSSITIGTAVTYIGDEAFRDSSIDTYNFVGDANAEPLTIGRSAFEGASGDELVLPAHTKYIGEAAFTRSDFYYGIVLNDGVETLGAYAFYDTEFGSWSADAVIIPPSVKTIGDYCFAKGSNYDYVDVEINAEGSVLEYIGKHAFEGNESFYSFTIPASVKVIDDYAFYDCYYLGYYPSYYGGLAFAADSTLETIGAHAFDECNYLEEITIPKSVKTIKAYAFANCGNLETVIFEEGGSDDLILGTPYTYSYVDVNDQQATAIERGRVFDNCKYLETVTLPERLVEIGEYSFYYAGGWGYGLTVSFGTNSRLATIGEGAFYYANLSTITIPKSVRNLEPVLDEATGEYRDRIGIGAKAFYYLYDSLTEVIFEAGSTEPLTIGEYAFDTCRLLETIELPARLAPYTSHTGEVIPPLANGAGVFNEATGLQAVNVSGTDGYYASVDGVLYTADMTELVFCPVAKEGTVSIPATVTKIHDRAFYECAALEAITFVGGENDMTIGNEAFRECEKITELVLPDNVKTIGTEAFYGCSELVALTLPAGLAGFDSGIVGGCPKLSTVTIGEGENAGFKLVGGVIFSIDGTELIYYPATLDATEYTVPDGVKYIVDGAFSGNTMLESITLPEGLIEIGANAFISCSVLESINIPGTVVLIGANAFNGCYSLSSVTFADSEEALIISEKAFYNNTSLESISFPERLAEIGKEAFYTASLSEISFAPESKLAVIGDMAFYRTSLVDVVLPEGIVSIGSSVFGRNYYLESITFGEGLVTIGDNTFTGCEALVEVYFPASLRTIGKYTFSDDYGEGCAALKTVVFANGSALEAIPEGTFAGTGIETIVIPASVKEIADKDTSTSYSYGAFWGCSSLTTVIFEDNSACTKIGAFAFYQCTSLDNFDIPVSVVSIGESAFEECSSLSSITIPATATQLGFEAFRSCSSLETVVLETRATELPGYMFAYCYALETVVIPSTVSSIGSNCFDGCISAFYVESGSAHYTAVDGVLYTADMTEFVFYPAYKTDSSITIPKEIVVIPEGLFYRNAYLREVIFEEGGTADLVIGANAFYDIPTLYKVVLPARLKAIGERAFSGCANLATINLPANLAEENVGYDAFYGCDRIVEVYNQSENEIEAGDYYAYEGMFASALRVYTEGESLVEVDEDGYITIAFDGEVYFVGYVGGETELVIPTGVTVVNYAALYDNSDITSVVIPEGVVEIGEYAFYYCTSLVNVTLPSTLEYIGYSAFGNCYDLGTVLIPERVTTVDSEAFSSCSNALFLIEAAALPDGWSSYWKSSSARAIWGYTGETIVYTFEVDGGTAIDSISSAMPITLPATAEKDGWYFAGWYADAELTIAINGEYYDSTNTVIYAKWITEQQYLEQFLGTGFDMPIVINVGDTVADTVEEKYQMLYFVFTPETTGYYKFYSTGETKYDPDMNCTLYDSSYNKITFSEDDNGYQFRIIRELTAGETYYFVVSTNYSSSGDYTVTLEEY